MLNFSNRTVISIRREVVDMICFAKPVASDRRSNLNVTISGGLMIGRPRFPRLTGRVS
jgi:hypothetical protein